MPKAKGGQWWQTFQKATYPAYVTLLDPPGVECLDLSQPRCRVRRVLLDDVLDGGGGGAPETLEIREGSFVLVLPPDAANPDKRLVSPPWLCRVSGIWFSPSAPGIRGGHAAPTGGSPEVVRWEQAQLRQGRRAAVHFSMQVTYFYRWPDIWDVIDGDERNRRRLGRSLRDLGAARSEAEVEAFLRKRGCGATPPSHLGMRYVVYSNHETQNPKDAAAAGRRGAKGKAQQGGEDQEGEEEEDEEDEEEEDGAGDDDVPVPMESVMGTAQVLFLESGVRLPCVEAPAAGRAAGAAAPQLSRLPPAQRAPLDGPQQRPVPGFVCNLFLDSRQQRLLGLREWADGAAGSDRSTSASRRQVKRLLQETAAHLAVVAPQAAQQGQGAAATAAATAAAATAPAAAEAGEGDDVFVDARSGSSGGGSGREGAGDGPAAADAEPARELPRRKVLMPASSSEEDGDEAQPQQQQQQQQSQQQQQGRDKRHKEQKQDQDRQRRQRHTTPRPQEKQQHQRTPRAQRGGGSRSSSSLGGGSQDMGHALQAGRAAEAPVAPAAAAKTPPPAKRGAAQASPRAAAPGSIAGTAARKRLLDERAAAAGGSAAKKKRQAAGASAKVSKGLEQLTLGGRRRSLQTGAPGSSEGGGGSGSDSSGITIST